MRVLKTEDCFYVAGGGHENDGDAGGFSDGGNYSGGFDGADATPNGLYAGLLGRLIEGILINGIYDGLKGIFNSPGGVLANPGTGNPMGDPGPSMASWGGGGGSEG